ncbi:MAG: methyl-accepting chemotaxis protein [Clostridiaceae bacterium]|nr:methyl-accepting chemotaxis protein [Clostridiaceae bacterium]
MAKTREKKDAGKKKRVSLSLKITALAVLPALIMSVVLTIVAMNSVRTGIKEEIIEKLQATTISMEGFCDAFDEGDYSLDADDNLIKGEFNITQNMEKVEKLVEGTNTEITFFYDGTCRATTLVDAETNEKMLGTSADQSVIDQVVGKGEAYTSYDLTINGEHYYAYYSPMKNADGSVIGMYFAGAPISDFQSFISEKRNTLIVVAVVIGVIAVLVILLVVYSIKKAIASTKNVITDLAAGKLQIEIEDSILKRSDELGDMAREVAALKDQLNQVVTRVKESSRVLLQEGQDLSQMASQTSSTADEIGHAVEDISKGAVSQAEEIETASSRIEEIGNMIEKIVAGVSVLDRTSDEMKQAGDQSIVIINDLSNSNDKTMNAIARIGEQVHATNESANKISEAIQLITSIAEETNLLSLNASIEAARAGEQGKGFAVVANQIQKLAEQSNESAQRIAEIINELLNDSENTVTVMTEVEKIVNEQQEKLTQTKDQFGQVSQGIVDSRDETSSIKTQTGACDSARVKVVDVITNLSAISEENAASTQETTASMQELNATINLLAESAANLSKLSDTLEEEMTFFQI